MSKAKACYFAVLYTCVLNKVRNYFLCSFLCILEWKLIEKWRFGLKKKVRIIFGILKGFLVHFFFSVFVALL